MSRLPRPLALIVASCLGLTVVLGGCTSTPTDPVTASASPSVGSDSGSTTPGSASSANTPTPDTPATETSGPAANSVTIDITIKDDQVSPNGAKVAVTKGQNVILEVTSDTDDEIHAHTAGDGYELEVKAGKPTTGEFVASDTGTFEIESHHLEKVIARLVVR